MKTTLETIYNPYKTFSGIERKTLLDQLTDIAREGFGTQITRDDVENHVFDVHSLYLIKDRGEIVGFSAYDRINEKNILYLQGIVLRQDYQKGGLFTRVNQQALSLKDFDYLAMRTQNPVVYSATEKIVDALYPCSSTIPYDVKEIATRIAKEYLGMKSFSSETFVSKATYSCSLYDIIPQHKCSSAFFDNILELDYQAGDSVLLLGGLGR